MGIIHRRAENKAIGMPRLFNEGVYGVVGKDAAVFGALAAADAVADGRRPQLKYFIRDALLRQRTADLL